MTSNQTTSSQPTPPPSVVYKILGAAEWQMAVRTGRYTGSADDGSDGYIHLSTADQVAETAAKHFRGRDDLVLVALDTARLGPQLRWEPSRGGALFPHLYGELDPAAAISAKEMPLAPEGMPLLPEGFPA